MDKAEFIVESQDELRDLLRHFNSLRKMPDGFVKAEVWEEGQVVLLDQNGNSLLADHVSLRFRKDGE